MRHFNSLILTAIALILCTLFLREWTYRQALAARRPGLTVYVTGEVKNPGVVTLPAGARRVHAVELCGGPTDKADCNRLEPARHLVDGETVVVPKVESTPRPQPLTAARAPRQIANATTCETTNPTPQARLNINQATSQELESLPGIGPVTARRIVEARNRLPGGTFHSLEDLTAIRGIKGKTMARLKPFLEPEGL